MDLAKVDVNDTRVHVPGIGLVYWDEKVIFLGDKVKFAELFPKETEGLNIGLTTNQWGATSLTHLISVKIADVTFETYMSEAEVKYFYGEEEPNGTSDSGIRDTELHQPQENDNQTC